MYVSRNADSVKKNMTPRLASDSRSSAPISIRIDPVAASGGDVRKCASTTESAASARSPSSSDTQPRSECPARAEPLMVSVDRVSAATRASALRARYGSSAARANT